MDLGLKNAWCEEFTLEEPLWKIANRVLTRQPQIVGLSVYLWNRQKMLELARMLKAVQPDLVIAMGGPEVSFETSAPEGVDHLISGEGETPWANLLCSHFGLTPPSLPLAPVFPYRAEDFPSLAGRLVYVETQRGCPFQCAFCLSGRDEKVREWIPQSRQEFIENIKTLTQQGAHIFKFLDRTFNARPAHALEWFKIFSKIENAAFHFEICAHLLNQETLDFLATVEPGKFQFEIGIQSLHAHTLESIGRKGDIHLTLEKMKRLIALKTVHLHADLLWGLPHDQMDSIISGFNEVLGLSPDELQLGFLKLLPGTKLLNDHAEHRYRYSLLPPYEIFSHEKLSGQELLRLKRFAYVFDLFYNKKRFRKTLAYLKAETAWTAFKLFEYIADDFQAKNLFQTSLAIDTQYQVLRDLFASQVIQPALLDDILRLDYASNPRFARIPQFLQSVPTSPGYVHFEYAHEGRTPGRYKVISQKEEGYYSAVTRFSLQTSSE